MYTLTDTAAQRCTHIAAHKAAEECEKEKTKKMCTYTGHKIRA